MRSLLITVNARWRKRWPNKLSYYCVRGHINIWQLNMIVRILWLLLILSIVDSRDDYVNEWAAEIKGGEKVAKEVAKLFDFKFMGQVSTEKDFVQRIQYSGSALFISRLNSSIK